MADLSDIEAVLVSTIAAIAYPDGTSGPSIAGTPVKVFRGWPIPANLDADLRAKKINISVYPSDTERRTTRYAPEWITRDVPPPSIALAASAGAIAITGVPAASQNACVVVNGTAYVHPVQAGDTLSTIATALAAQISNDTPATSSGATIAIPGAHSLAARVGTVGTTIREIRRQRRTFQVTTWCPTPASRDLIASAVDEALADIDFLTLPDGSSGRLLYERSHVGDQSEKEGLYRRDLFYSVEYATTQVRQGATIVAPVLNLGGLDGGPIPPAQPQFFWDAGRWDDGISRWSAIPPIWDRETWDTKLNWDS